MVLVPHRVPHIGYWVPGEESQVLGPTWRSRVPGPAYGSRVPSPRWRVLGGGSWVPLFRYAFQTGDINILVLRCVCFSRYIQLKSSFSDEKTSAVKSETHFGREAKENWRGKVLKENSVIDKNWSSAKLFIIVQDYAENANGNAPLIVENVWYF